MCIAVALDQVFARWVARYVRGQAALGRKPKQRRPQLALSHSRAAQPSVAKAGGGAAETPAGAAAGVGSVGGCAPAGAAGPSQPLAEPASPPPVRSASTIQSEDAARARALAMQQAAVEDRGDSFYEPADEAAEGDAEAQGSHRGCSASTGSQRSHGSHRSPSSGSPQRKRSSSRSASSSSRGRERERREPELDC